MSDVARDYQEKGIDETRTHFAAGWMKVLIWLATGAGKTFLFCRMVKSAVERGGRCIIVVRGRKLVDQASQRLFREGVDHGVLMANHWNYRPGVRVQVCSIDTMIARDIWPEADLVIIDEAHLFTKGSKAGQIAERYPEAFIVPCTATPWVDGGLRHLADVIVHPITMEQLIEQGYLMPFRMFSPSSPDLSKVETSKSTGDYVVDQLEGAMVAGQLTGKIIDHWKKLAVGRPTICFAVNIRHSRMLVERFKAAGVRAEHCDADVPDEERNEIIKRLESGETEVVCNVGIFCTGVDIPRLGCIVMARPTQSRNLFIQQAGRGTRLFPGKTDCLLLDHAGNIDRLGFPTDEPEVSLDCLAKEGHQKKTKLCKNCFAQYRGAKCPECGVEAPEVDGPEIAETNEELKEITMDDIILRTHKNMIKEAKKAKRKPSSAHYRLIDKFGFEAAKKYLPPAFVERYERGTSNLFANSRFKGFSK